MNIQMKDSGIEWLGQIPAHWEVKRLKHVAELRKDKLNQMPDGALYIGLENIESWSGSLRVEATQEDIDGSVNVFSTGDVLFGKLRPYLAKVALVDFGGVCTTEVIPIRSQTGIIAGFLTYCMLNASFIEYVSSMTYGAKMPRVSPEQLSNSGFPIPPLPEQRAISNFLDAETELIDPLVEKKQRLVDLLTERRQAIITQAVTEGIKGDREIPGSGTVQPTSERTLRLRHFAQINPPVDFWHRVPNDALLTFLPLETVWGNNTDYSNLRAKRDVAQGYTRFVAGDVLVPKITPTFEAGRSVHVRRLETCAGTGTTELHVIRPLNQIAARFVSYLVQSREFLLGGEGNMSGVAGQQRVPEDWIKDFPVRIREESEQRAVADFLDAQTVRIDTLVTKLQRQIELLAERRQAVIIAAVTGKLDVSAAIGQRIGSQ